MARTSTLMLALLLSQVACCSLKTSQQGSVQPQTMGPSPLKVGEPSVAANIDSHRIFIHNTGNETIRWYLGEAPAWLRFSSTNGELGAGEKNNLLFTVDRNMLDSLITTGTMGDGFDTYIAELTFSSGDSSTFLIKTKVKVSHYAPRVAFSFSTKKDTIDWVEFDGVRSVSIVPGTGGAPLCYGQQIHDPPHLATGNGGITDDANPKIPATTPNWTAVRRPGVYTWFYSQNGKIYGPNVAVLTGNGCSGFTFP